MPNLLKQKVLEGELFIGMSTHINSEVVVEIMGMAGFDYVFIDTEHSPTSMETVEKMVRAADSVGMTPIVRVYKNDRYLIMRALDVGAKGIVVPQIRSAEDAQRAVEFTRYPPDGTRTMCPGVRAAGYRLINWDTYWPEANKEILLFVLIENREAVDNLDQILSVPGVDVIFLGPADYAQEIGLPVNHPKVEAVMQNVARKALAAGKQVLSVLLMDLTSTANYLTFKQMKRNFDMGIRGFMFPRDVFLLAQYFKDLAESRSKLSAVRPECA